MYCEIITFVERDTNFHGLMKIAFSWICKFMDQINHRQVILIYIWHDFRIHMCKAGLKPIDSSTHKSTLQVYREKLVITRPTFVHVNYILPKFKDA